MTRAVCMLCAHHCRLAPGETGRCGVRANRRGTLVDLFPDRPAALADDPVEKKPLYHFLPGSRCLSVALYGCNMSCAYCQNAAISQAGAFPPPAGRTLSPAEFAERWRASGADSAAFTYSEPTVWLEWLVAAAGLVKAAGGRCVLVSNGYFSRSARARLAPLIDAYNIDLKGDDDFYRRWCGARAAPVLANLRAAAALPAAIVEACTLVVEGLHSVDGLLRLGEGLAAAGLRVWHLSRFHPAWRMSDRPPGSEEFLARAVEAVAARIAIPHVYAGNSRLRRDSRCPGCGFVLVDRAAPAAVRADPRFRRTADGSPPVCPGCGRPQYFAL